MINLPIKIQEAKEKFSVFMVELYIIYLPTVTLRYAACDEDIVFAGETYTAAPIQRDIVKSTTDAKVDNTKLTVSDFDSSFTLALLTGYNFLGCRAIIFQIMYPESLTDPLNFAPVFWGDLDNPVLTEKDATFTIDICAPTTYLQNARTMQLPCNSEYADGVTCMASLDIQTGTVQAGTTAYSVIIEQSEEADYRVFGLITIGYETRLITASTGNTITVDYPFNEVPTGIYSVQRGCDKGSGTCAVRGQTINYSGFLNVPFLYSVKS